MHRCARNESRVALEVLVGFARLVDRKKKKKKVILLSN